jgi:hypothetical protein
MKQKRPAYKRFKPIPYEHHLESHTEVRVGSRGQIGGHMTYRKPAMSSPPRSNTEEFSHAAMPPAAHFDADLNNNTTTSSNEVHSANVRDFQLHFQGEK